MALIIREGSGMDISTEPVCGVDVMDLFVIGEANISSALHGIDGLYEDCLFEECLLECLLA